MLFGLTTGSGVTILETKNEEKNYVKFLMKNSRGHDWIAFKSHSSGTETETPSGLSLYFSFVGEPDHSSSLPEPDREAGRGGSEEGELHLHVSVQGTELLFIYFRYLIEKPDGAEVRKENCISMYQCKVQSSFSFNYGLNRSSVKGTTFKVRIRFLFILNCRPGSNQHSATITFLVFTYVSQN
jgi:hypothetical protein